MMKKYWKRNAVIAALLIFVCVAVFLNWRYNKVSNEDYIEYEDSGKLLGESTLVNEGTNGLTADSVLTGEGEAGDALFISDENNYFSAARLSRQKSRDAAASLLEEALNVQNITDETVAATSEGLEKLAALTVSEAKIESLIIAKGFEDCVAFASDDEISLVVSEPEDGLTVSDIAKITDIVTSEFPNYTASMIKIVGVNT
ncbi:MAG: SpoIIIAH-like family protein [Oscillospiraceae bacterium]|jgi:stage III sporulation protein AH